MYISGFNGNLVPETALFALAQHESTGAEPLDELYDALADVLNEEESTRCYKNYLLVRTNAASLEVTVNQLN